jgi:N-acetylglutamate synthase-like GNAT family acetyltransferase
LSVLPDSVLVGFAGYEEHDGSALLRSVVVVPSARGTGSGRAIVEALLRAMRDIGIERTYLLTTTAEDFFRHLGFAEIARQEAPAVILATPQAMTICRTAALLSRAT